MEVQTRADRVRERLAASNCDGLLVTNLVNVRYLCGFTGSNGVLWLGLEDMVLVTDRRYETQAEKEITQAQVEAEVQINNDPKKILVTAVGQAGCIGLEAASVSWANQRKYLEWFADIELVPTEGLVEHCRQIKDAGELGRIAGAAAIADEALAKTLPMLAEGPTEAQVASALDSTMRHLGAETSAFATIVASGPNAALPHHRPTERTIGAGELVIIDMGAVLEGYRSDMTRTVAVGEPSSAERKVFETVKQAQRLGVEQVTASGSVADIDTACRTHIAAAGWADAFVHGTGHGVGLDIHELPWVRAKSTEQLQPNHVLTVEPGVYLAGKCGARVEDTVAVTADGPVVLTKSSKELLVSHL